MPGERLTLFPQIEDSQFAPFELTDPLNGLHVMEHAYPPPPRAIDWAGSVDTEGDEPASIKWENREIPLKVRVREPQDPAATNQITTPSAEGGVGAWTTFGANTLVQSNEQAYVGDYSLKATYGDNALFAAKSGSSVNADEYVFMSIWIYVPTSWDGGQLTVGDEGQVSGSSGDVTVGADMALRDQWQRITFFCRNDADVGDTFSLFIRNTGTAATVGRFFYLDAASVITSATNDGFSPYFDGDSAGCKWTGARHASRSTRPAPGGSRRDAIIADLQQAMATVIERKAGVLRRIPPNGTAIYFDLRDAEADQVFDNRYIHSGRSEASIKLIAKPFARGDDEGEQLLDDFSVDSITAGRWAFDLGVGTLAVSAGQLVPSSTAAKRLYRTDREFHDCEVTAKVTIGAAKTAFAFGPILKRLGVNDYLRGMVITGGTGLFIGKIVGGVGTTLATSSFTFNTGTSYWIRFRIEGNKLTCEAFTSAPTPQSTAVTSCTYTLATGAEEDQFGIGVPGGVGFSWSLQGTDERVDDFSVTPDAYVERTLPVLTPTVSPVKGDVRALGKLLLEEIQGANQDFVIAALQSKDYDAAATAALFYEAEGRTALGGAATAVGTSPASGGGSNVMRQGTLTPAWQAMLSTQASGGGAHLTHVGDYHVWARIFRPTGNTGAVSLRLDWAVGDFRRYTANTPVDFDASEIEGQWLLVDLGLVHLPKVQQGAQKWEGRVVASSTVAGDDLDVDWLAIVPTDRYAELHSVLQFAAPTSFSARDEFDQTAGVLVGKVLPVGGTWAGAGDADDYSVDTSTATAKRTVTNDANIDSGHYALAGTGVYAAIAVEAEFIWTNQGLGGESNLTAVFARYVDTNNWIMAGVLSHEPPVGRQYLVVRKRVAGTVTELARVDIQSVAGELAGYASPVFKYRVRLAVSESGAWTLWGVAGESGTPALVAAGQDAVLGTGQALDDGRIGLYDAANGAGTPMTERFVDNFLAFTPTFDAAIFASQSLEWRHDEAIREDSSGAVWQPVSSGVRGDHLVVPASSREGRTTRFFVKACRGPVYRDGSAGAPAVIGDPNIDDISARLTYTPRGLMVAKP